VTARYCTAPPAMTFLSDPLADETLAASE